MNSRIIMIPLCLCFVPWSSALQCYFCADTGDDNKCEKYSTYEEAFNKDESPILRNCTAGSDNICFIEIYKSSLGPTTSHIRDCNNGSSFSFSHSQHKDKYDRLNKLEENNKTACVYDGLSMVCLSKCHTDFCNGPQINGAIAMTLPMTLPLSVLFLILSRAAFSLSVELL